MKLNRTGLAAAAVGALMSLPLATAQAAESPLVVTSFSGPSSQGWAVDETHDYKFKAGPASIGTGSLQFEARPSAAGGDKMYLKHELDIAVKDYRKISFDYFIDPSWVAPTGTTRAQQFYLNVYVDMPDVPTVFPTFYDCKYDYIATNDVASKWHTVAGQKQEMTLAVTAKNGAQCGDQISDLDPTDKVFRVAVNGGDTSTTDNTIKGAIDNVVVTTAGPVSTVYDFEPAAVTPPTPTTACAATNNLPTITGTTGNDLKNGTDVAQKIDLLAGNDQSDAKGGADCVLGGDGNDQLKGGAGDDEIQSGAGNDNVDAGAGKDVVDAGAGNDLVNVKDSVAENVNCGTGNDIAIADGNDILTGCEIER